MTRSAPALPTFSHSLTQLQQPKLHSLELNCEHPFGPVSGSVPCHRGRSRHDADLHSTGQSSRTVTASLFGWNTGASTLKTRIASPATTCRLVGTRSSCRALQGAPRPVNDIFGFLIPARQTKPAALELRRTGADHVDRILEDSLPTR